MPRPADFREKSPLTVDWLHLHPHSRKPKGWRKWMGCAGVTSSGVVIVPTRILGESTAMNAAWDGVPLYQHEGLVFVSIDWIVGEARTDQEKADFRAIKAEILKRHATL